MLLPAFFFFNDTATTEIYTLSLHDALPISVRVIGAAGSRFNASISCSSPNAFPGKARQDRKSTRLNSSHSQISYAVFCLKKKIAIRSAGRLAYISPESSQPPTQSHTPL